MSDKNIFSEIEMMPIPAGTEQVRHYHDAKKWISSNSKMSIPGQKGNLTETESVENIRAFELSKYPITKYQYHKVTQQRLMDDENASEPMVNVFWHDAAMFCNLLSEQYGLKSCYSFSDDHDDVDWDMSANGFRLPTDAEWQYACRAGSTEYRYGPLDDIAWFQDNADGKIHPVGLKAPNRWGLYDMLGNVWEWCWDLYDKDTYGSYRVFRGGSWAEASRSCGATSRRRSHPSFQIEDLGFRVARSV